MSRKCVTCGGILLTEHNLNAHEDTLTCVVVLKQRLAAAEAENARLRESLKVERDAVKRLNERLANCSKSSKSSTHTCGDNPPACNMNISPAREN